MFLSCFTRKLKKKTTVSFHTSELSPASSVKAFKFFSLPFFFFSRAVLCAKAAVWVPSCGAGQASRPSLASMSVWSWAQLPPSPHTHSLAMDWAFLGMPHLAAICQPRLPSAEDIWRGILSPWGVTKQTRLSEQTLLRKNENSTPSERAAGAWLEEIAQAQTKAFLPADPNNVCWGWWWILLLKPVCSSAAPANEAGLLEWSCPGQQSSRLQLERGSCGYGTKDSQSSGILLLCQHTDPASC